jgi:hypothetical protein
MATFNVSWTIDNNVGTVGTRVRYRIKGTSIWSSFIVDPSDTTASFQADNNRIYDVQFQNINNDGNPLSTIVNGIGFSDPDPALSPTNTTLGYTFENLSEDIDSYTVSVALFTAPGTYIATHYLSPAEPVTDEFTGLTPGTPYYLYITPVADEFSKTFIYTFITEATATCPVPQNIVATLS